MDILFGFFERTMSFELCLLEVRNAACLVLAQKSSFEHLARIYIALIFN